jgi:hypothetical protein
MSRAKEYENRIPAFYRKKTIDLMLFTHVTALHFRNNMELKDAILDFYEMYGIDELEFPVSNALKVYSRVRNNFLWSELKKTINNK